MAFGKSGSHLQKRKRDESIGTSSSSIDASRVTRVLSDTTATTSTKMKCPYLDTINRNVLDFDFEKVCSVSLTNLNVYSCLVCGRFFQGRGKNTHCFTHSVQMGHHVFMNLCTCRIYCLPDNYEVSDSSLDDIVRALRPSFSPEGSQTASAFRKGSF